MLLKGQVVQCPNNLNVLKEKKLIKTIPAGTFLTVKDIKVLDDGDFEQKLGGIVAYEFNETTEGNFSALYPCNIKFIPISELTEEEIRNYDP